MRFRRALASGAAGAVVALALAAAIWWLLRLERGVRDVVAGGALAGLPWGWRVAVAAAVVAGGAVLAIGYAVCFEWVTRRAGWWIGAAVGVAHGTALWLAVGCAAWLFPNEAQRVAGELSLLFDRVAAVAGLVGAHAAYGAMVGALYGAPRHRGEPRWRVAWRELFPTEKRFE